MKARVRLISDVTVVSVYATKVEGHGDALQYCGNDY